MNKSPQFILTILFIVYLVLGANPPLALAALIDTVLGKIIIVTAAMCLFAYSNPVLGVLGLFVAYELVRRSMAATGSLAIEMYYPTEIKKWAGVPKMHEFPYTLEQEMVKKMTAREETDYSKAPYGPSLDNLHDASYL